MFPQPGAESPSSNNCHLFSFCTSTFRFYPIYIFDFAIKPYPNMRSFNSVAIALASALLTSAASPYSRRSIAYLQQNGPAAKALNDQYHALTASSPCNDDDVACIGGQFASCWDGSYHLYSCPGDWTCAAIPNEWSSGTTTTCDSPDNIAWRFAQAGISESKRSIYSSPPKACVLSPLFTTPLSLLSVAVVRLLTSSRTVRLLRH